MISLSPGVIAILLVAVLFIAYGSYTIGKRVGWNASSRNTVGRLLPLLSQAELDELRDNDPSKTLLKALNREIIRRKKT